MQAQRTVSGPIAIQRQLGQQQQQQPVFRTQSPHDPHRHNKPVRSSSLAQAPETQDTVGDELDNIAARDIAMARYKRNHDYLSEIFTPYAAESITAPSLELPYTEEQVDKQIEEYKEKAVKQKQSHNERMLQLEQEQKRYWDLMNRLNNADSIESIEEASKDLSSELNVQLEHSKENVKVLSINL